MPDPNGEQGGTIANVVRTSLDLEPGTYCGGLYITGQAVVSLKPGVYVMKDGPLIVDANATLRGSEVGFYFTGDKGGLLFDRGSTIALSARLGGPMEGILMAEAPTVDHPVDPLMSLAPATRDAIGPTPPGMGASAPMRTYRIISDHARSLTGTLYLPSGRIVIDASQPVADMSHYTIVVARQINLFKGSTLILNANYAASPVPVPKGLGPVAGRILLTK